MSAIRRGPRNAQDRVRNLLVMLPWLMEQGEVPLADVAERFGLTEAEVTKDLELVAMCGLPPYVDEMIDVFVDDGLVFVGVPRLFTKPLALTAPEGFALLVAARAAMELPGVDNAGPLARGLTKLEAVLSAAGIDAGGDATTGVALDFARPALTDDLVDATAAGAELAIEYRSPSRDEVSQRTIVPRHVFIDGENWYVLADDGKSQERRTFRIDRIVSAAETGVTVEVDPTVEPPSSFFGDEDLPRVTLRVTPRARWIAERYPVDSVEPVDGSDDVDVVLPVASDWWLDRLLVRLGPDCVSVDAADRRNGAAVLAERMLARYA